MLQLLLFLVLVVSSVAYSQFVRVDQGLTQADRDFMYTASEGSEVMPLKWFLSLRRSQDDMLFRESLEEYGLVYDNSTKKSKNPYGLPIGVTTHINKKTKHLYGEAEWVGINCTACHTSQIDIGSKKLLVDGGAGLFGIQKLEFDMISSVRSTLANKSKLDKFLEETKTSAKDAPKVVEYLKLFSKEFTDVVNRAHPLYVDKKGREVKSGPGRMDGLGAPTIHLSCELTPRMGDPELNKLFTDPRNCPKPHAVVSYPHLWGMADYDWVQWNGSVHFSLGRNYAQATLTFAKNWVERTPLGIPVVKSTAKIDNLIKLESKYQKLKSPEWSQLVEAGVVAPLDDNRVRRGEVLYRQNCLSCHAVQPEVTDRFKTFEPNVYFKSSMHMPKEIGVDPYFTENINGHKSYITKGIREHYSMLLSPEEKDGTAKISSQKLRGINILIMSLNAFTEHKGLQFSLDTLNRLATSTPMALPADILKTYVDYMGCRNLFRLPTEDGLRARSLEGIMFTAPYLHNGSVPTLYDLLKPQSKRPATFLLGCNRYDVVRLGYNCSKDDRNTEVFDTRLESNSNSGHEYGTHLNHEERLDLIEYVKSIKNPKRPLRIGTCY